MTENVTQIFSGNIFFRGGHTGYHGPFHAGGQSFALPCACCKKNYWRHFPVSGIYSFLLVQECNTAAFHRNDNPYPVISNSLKTN